MLKKVLTVLLVLTMMTTMLVGCGSKGSEVSNNKNDGTKKSAKDSVVMVIPSDISTLDPHNNSAVLSQVVFQNIYDTLLDYYQGKFTPRLCESYKVSDDGLKYTFLLKKGVKFHNGEEMKASDVAFSLMRAKGSPQMAANTAYISNASATNDYTVEVSLTKPYVPFLLSVGASIHIISEKAAKEYGDDLKSHPVGTGAYKFVKWDAGQQVVLERFENWYGGTAPIKTATFKVIGDPSSAVVALETGEIDLTYAMPAISIKSIEKNANLKLEKVRTLGCGYLPLNLDKAPLNDVNFRMAMNYAIDRQKIIDVALEGVGVISNGILSSDYVGYSDKIKPFELNVDKAKEYLSKSTYKGQELSIKVGSDAQKKQATLFQEDLRKIGVNTKIEQMEMNAWIADMTKGNYEISCIVMTRQPDADLWSIVFHSSGIDKALNFSRLRSKEVDSAFEEGTSIMDPQRRIENYERISKVLKDEAIIVPLFFKVATPAYVKALKVTRFYQDGYAYVKDLSWE